MGRNDDKPLTPAQARERLLQGIVDSLAGDYPGPIVFRLKRSKKAGETYPLKLTQKQRETLLSYVRLGRSLKKKFDEVGEGTQIVAVTRNELDKLNEETDQAVMYAPGSDKKRLMAVQTRVAKFFEAEHAAIFEPKPLKQRKRHLTKSNLVYPFKITLLDIKPPIWRLIQVPDCTLPQFHEYIQAAFGWENYHLHEFEINSVRYTEPAPDGDDFGMEFVDETDVLLSNLLSKSAKRAPWIYEYDFGDGWKHEIVIEGSPINDSKLKSPVCLDGERACPPEDSGGPWGYADYLDAIADPQHESHEELLEWRGPFDPESFDLKKATREMRKVKQ